MIFLLVPFNFLISTAGHTQLLLTVYVLSVLTSEDERYWILVVISALFKNNNIFSFHFEDFVAEFLFFYSIGISSSIWMSLQESMI